MLSIFTAVAVALILVAVVAGLLFRPKTVQVNPEVLTRLAALEQGVRDLPTTGREEGHLLREEVRGALGAQQQALETRLTNFSQLQATQLTDMRKEALDGRAKLEEALKAANDAFAQVQTTRLGETNAAMKELAERQEKGLVAVEQKIKVLTEANDKKQGEIREALTTQLDQLRKENEGKLEQMRATVEEKLQGTLEQRLGESFKMVSERLEAVHKGLGEMQTLASGVGDLKRVLSNVKSRGGWGEVQLGALLDDMLTAEQFEKNVRVLPGSSEQVEYAIRLPGKSDAGTSVYLPIDAKFPREDYDRLISAQESGLADEVEKAGVALERAIRLQAKTICEKYVHPPHTTDFGVMYLATEGLFAEVIRRPGLTTDLQTKYRIMVTGPTTLAAVLNSLQMGFRTLAIEKRSSEVWQVLAAAKTEFGKYAQVWDKLGEQLERAQKTVATAGVRTRAVERTLRNVETLEIASVETLLALPEPEEAAGADVDELA